jgi:beta-phosphoglucomutase-like phosphatase (HAD superfamily)
VYLEAAARLGVDPGRCAAVEDSANGIRAAVAAGMRVVAVPNHAFPPPRDVLDRADLVVTSVAELRPEVLEGLPARA